MAKCICQKCGDPCKPKSNRSSNQDLDVGSRLRLCPSCEWEMIDQAEAENVPLDELFEMAG